MKSTSKSKYSRLVNKLCRPLVSAGLIAGGLFHMADSAFALGTAATTQIDNQATATYQSGANTLNAVSNTVSVIVSPIAGVTVVNDQIVDLDGNAVEAGDVVSYYFTVTNVGNYQNVIRIPTAVDVTNLDADGDNLPDATVDVTGTTYLGQGIVVLYDQAGNGLDFTDSNGSGSWDPGETGADVWVYDSGQGDYYNGTTKWDNASVSIPADASFTVVVTAQAPNDPTNVGAGDPLTVTLGDTITSPPGSVAGQQNVPYVADATGDNDVLTVNDFNNDATEDDADFVNGQREAGATQSVPYAASVNPLAIAAVKKSGVYTPNTVSTYADDTIAYTLDLEVRDTDPTNLFQPSSLAGIQINLNGATANRIIVSDLLPVDAAGNSSVLQSVSTNLPAGWTAVYSTDDTAATGNEAPTTARWWTSFGAGAGQPANLAAVKRVGFVYNGALSAGYNTATVAGSLTFTVVLSNSNTATSNSLAVYNVAQVVGITQGDDPAAPTNPIYDESGDDRANNYSDNGTAPAADGSNYDPATDTGAPINEDEDTSGTLEADELDVNNDNTGTDTNPSVGSGEPNLITAIRTTQDSILIGPNGQPAAVGPDGTQDTDFTNATQPFTPTDGNGDGIFDDFDPAEIVITNTIQNPNTTGFIARATVEPADISLVPGSTAANNTDIPDGTVVRISFGGTDVYYGYDQASGTWSVPYTDAALTAGNETVPLMVDAELAAGESHSVTVGIDLPSISGITYNTLPSYPINLVVFPEDNLVTTPGYSGETTYNLTIDRLYPAGFIELEKSARIYTYDQDTGVVSTTPTAYSTTPDAYAAATGSIRPNDVIEYRVIYTNISEPASGTGNVILTGNTFVLTEDGTTAVNNWATYSLHQSGTNTGKEAADPAYRGTVTYDGSATQPGDDTVVDVYVNTVPSVSPGIAGTFTFKRQIQ